MIYTTKQIAILILTIFVLTSCGLGGRVVMPDDDIAGNHTPEEVWVTYKFKRMDWSYDPWDYIHETVCGWGYDPWMNNFEEMNVCNYECIERPKYDHLDWFYPSWERCMYFDYKQQGD